MLKYAMPYVAQTISSEQARDARRWVYERKRRQLGESHILSVYLNITDPYSYLLVQALKTFDSRYDVRLRFYTCNHRSAEMYPDMDRWISNADHDARALAALYGFNFPTQKALHSPHKVNLYTSRLLALESQVHPVGEIVDLFDEYWMSEDASECELYRLNRAEIKKLECNANRRERLGHYFDGMIHYQGEWYWGIDRLDHLESRLNKLGVKKSFDSHENTDASAEDVRFSLQYDSFCSAPRPSCEVALPKLVVYYSARSPYSYLGLERAAQLADHYGLELEIKPVLPMVMRGMPVPQDKKMYIFLDCKREADKFEIPYGKVADPVGAGVERCYALFEYAQSEGKALDYLLAFGRAVNANGLHADSDETMQKVVEEAGLDWHFAKYLVDADDWRVWAGENLDEMLDTGLWGVPSFRFGGLNVWGQDRLWRIEKEIERIASEI